MKRLILTAMLLRLLLLPVCAMEFVAPEAPESVAAQVEAPADSFGEGLWNVIRAALSGWDGALREALNCCLAALSAVLICSMLRETTGGLSQRTVEMACTAGVAAILLEPSSTLIHLGTDTAAQLSEYGKLLLPVMTGAMAAQGGVTASAALHAGTVLFDSVLSSLLTKLMVPMLHLFLALAIAVSVLHEPLLEKMRDFIQWGSGWVLKIVLYLFTGYMTVTGVVSGHADAAAVRAAKAAISTAVPVVGGILSDASEAVLVSAGTLGSAAGIYGILTVIALFSGPFLRIGVQYLVLKGVGALCSAFGGSCGTLMEDFSSAMGLLLAMIGTQTVMLMISTMCLMKGVG